MVVIVFLDTEFSDLLAPQVLSIGLVALDGREHYVELDLTTEVGRARVTASSEFVRWGGVLGQWGMVPGAACSEWEMGRRTGDWLLALAGEAGTRLEVAFDYAADFELLEHAIRNAGLWDRVREVVMPVNIAGITGSMEGELAAQACYREIGRRGLRRHHALADGLALRAAYLRVKDSAVRLARALNSEGIERLIAARVETTPASQKAGGATDAEVWLRIWLTTETPALDGLRPLDVIERPGGVQRLEQLLRGLKAGRSA